MTQNVITQAALLAELPDNTTRQISPQRVRDMVVSLAPFIASRDPGANDDQDDTSAVGGKFGPGQFWFNQAFGTLWVCQDGTAGAALWYNVGMGLLTGYAIYWWNAGISTSTVNEANTTVGINYIGTGDAEFTFNPGFVSQPFTVQVSYDDDPNLLFVNYTCTATNKVRVRIYDNAGNPHDPAVLSVTVMGRTV